MSKWGIELIDIGRRKVCRTIEITAKTLPDVEQRAIQECSKHLRSRNIGLMDKCDLTYTVAAGFHSVGKVKISTL